MAVKPRIAFQGASGAFSEEAAYRFDSHAEPIGCPTFDDVVAAVTSGHADLGALPVENTIHGCVTGSYDALAKAELIVLGETILPIRHCLMASSETALAQVRRVISHPVALAQCGRFLGELDGVEIVAVYDTAGAAEEVARSDSNEIAAIASRGAAGRYALEILASDVQDTPDNQTRFFLVSRPDMPVTRETGRLRAVSAWKTALIAETANEPGALHRLLEVFADAEINLTQLQSRPAATPWTYRFFLEYQHSEPASTTAAVDRARKLTKSMVELGTFPVAGR